MLVYSKRNRSSTVKTLTFKSFTDPKTNEIGFKRIKVCCKKK